MWPWLRLKGIFLLLVYGLSFQPAEAVEHSYRVENLQFIPQGYETYLPAPASDDSQQQFDGPLVVEELSRIYIFDLVYRLADGRLIGRFREHPRFTMWAYTLKYRYLHIGDVTLDADGKERWKLHYKWKLMLQLRTWRFKLHSFFSGETYIEGKLLPFRRDRNWMGAADLISSMPPRERARFRAGSYASVNPNKSLKKTFERSGASFTTMRPQPIPMPWRIHGDSGLEPLQLENVKALLSSEGSEQTPALDVEAVLILPEEQTNAAGHEELHLNPILMLGKEGQPQNFFLIPKLFDSVNQNLAYPRKTRSLSRLRGICNKYLFGLGL